MTRPRAPPRPRPAARPRTPRRSRRPRPARAPPPRRSRRTARRPRAQIHNVSLTLSTTPADVESVSDSAMRVADQLGGYVSGQLRDRAPERRHHPLRAGRQAPAGAHAARAARARQLAHAGDPGRDGLQDATGVRRARRAGVSRLAAHPALARDDRPRGLEPARAAAARRVRPSLHTSATWRGSDSRRRWQRSTSRSAATATRARAAPVKGGSWTPGDALHDAGRVLEVVAGVLLIALAVIVPIGLLALIAVLVGRLVTRRRRERALELRVRVVKIGV